jgi:hypothetical protein
MKNVHDYLQLSGLDAEEAHNYNKDLQPHMRISRVGLPLVDTLIADFVFPKLPELTPRPKTKERLNADYVKRSMSQATGYLFEQLVIDVLSQEPGLEVHKQMKLEYQNLTGTCDIIVLNHKDKKATVVECKALKYGTKKECCVSALFNNDLTGYTSQLAIYKEAAALKLPGYTTEATWMVWAKKSASLFKVPFAVSGADSKLLASDSVDKTNDYANFKSAFEAKDQEACLKILKIDELPMKNYGFGGYKEAACPIHFSPWSKTLLDENGLPYDDAETTLALMLCFAMNRIPSMSSQIEEKLLSLLQQDTEEQE